MAKKKAGKDDAAGGSGEASGAGKPWVCEGCEQENEPIDDVCCACEEPRPAGKSGAADAFAGYVVGEIISAEAVPKKDKLTVLQVDIGAEEPLQVVTNAPNAVVGARVVVATAGAVFKGESGEDEVVKKGAVGGVMSAGMLCNGVMLGWKGGDNKAAATLPDSFAIGSKPPDSRPRKDV